MILRLTNSRAFLFVQLEGAARSTWFRGVVLSLLFMGVVHGAPPEWLRPALATDISVWKNTSPVVRLHESLEVRYLAEDRVRRKVRLATRVTKESGRSEAEMVVSYNADTDRVMRAQAWVIAPDGKKTTAFARTEFTEGLVNYSQQFWNAERALRFSRPDKLAIGSVVACEVEIEAQSGIFDSSWAFSTHVPVIAGLFEVTPMPGGALSWFASSQHVPAPIAGTSAGSLKWEMRNLAPLPSETPTGFLPNPLRVSVRCARAGDTSLALRSWHPLVSVVANIIEPQIVVAESVKAQATALIATRSARWDRIRAITEFVQKDVPYLSVTLDKDSLAGYRPHRPADVLQRRLGDCKDKAALVAAMLRAIGDNAYLVLVYAGNPTAVVADWPSAYFNHAIVAIPADNATPGHWPIVDGGALGQLVLFDATDPGTPLGVLSLADQGGFGLIVAATGPGVVQLPGERAAHLRQEREIEANLSPTGDLNARVKETYLGSSAARLQFTRFRLGEDGFARALQTRLHETIPLIAQLRWDDEWTPATSTYRVNSSFTAERYARAVSREMLLVSPRVISNRVMLTPWNVEHEGKVWLSAEQIAENVRLRLPSGFKLEEMPTSWTCDTAQVTCSLTYTLDGDDLVYAYSVTRAGGTFDKKEYDTLRDLYRQIDEAERRPAVLVRARSNGK